MAKIPTGRIILYVILGIIVIIVGVWVIKTRQRESQIGKRVVEVEDIPKEVNRWTKTLDGLAQDFASYSGPSAAQAQELMAKARAGIEEFQTLTDPQELTKKRNEIQDYIAELRKLKRLAIRGQ
ncbi:MAG: hypothetical protein ACP5JB_03770 [candidate division WOR-3 bacterium]|jgi:hypothetical protein